MTEQVLDRYLRPDETQLRPDSLREVFQRLLESAQNANMRAGVIGAAIGGVEKLAPVLFDFDPVAVSRAFPDGWEQVLDLIESELSPRGSIRRTSRSIWPHYCRTILSGAAFLSQFSDAADFFAWVNILDQDDRTRPALPMLLSAEVKGLGFALACDFLMGMGYLNFGKPDVHVKKILHGLQFTSSGTDDFEAFKAIIAIAKDAGVSPYYVDKVLWLVGSGYFYDHDTIGHNGRIKTDRDAFIQWALASGGAPGGAMETHDRSLHPKPL